MLDLFSSLVSYILSRLKVYLVEKQVKQVQERKAKGPFGRTVGGPI